MYFMLPHARIYMMAEGIEKTEDFDESKSSNLRRLYDLQKKIEMISDSVFNSDKSELGNISLAVL